MSVQSGMISEPPVNVNDSDHSAVTWLSIFFYSLRVGARVARFRRGKGKQQQQQRQKLHWALLMVPWEQAGSPLLPPNKTTYTGRTKGFCSE